MRELKGGARGEVEDMYVIVGMKENCYSQADNIGCPPNIPPPYSLDNRTPILGKSPAPNQSGKRNTQISAPK